MLYVLGTAIVITCLRREKD